ncbi:FHA domain-containing protein [Vibrio sp. ZSDZ65]|uniref:FHA domain-containing protein n=1 Tax=Vibrio qingdaonensis TaxID=2829491 RepID=A0A9X3HVL3_9VIBR|nr:FHA domain-containing protein [Vibrio qingdaonensis]MCW8345441.1 FHA domain-containing protein [Vibrio qingdaonensis]
MAFLISQSTNYQVYLKAFHQFGRLTSAVDTVIDSPEISRIHGIIEWIDAGWYIRDISKNGIWLNNQPITANSLQPLSLHDTISFANRRDITFVVENLDKPCDALVPMSSSEPDDSKTYKPILLQQYHFLPSETSPELIIYYDVSEKQWYCENLSESSVHKIEDGEMLEFSHSMWQLMKGVDQTVNETVAINENVDADLCYVFNISQDEELTELTLKNRNGDIDCDTRTHHYLTALLARYKGQDRLNSLPADLQGWRSIEQLTKDIGLSESHVNIQIHRARKQISDKLLSAGICEPLLIERKRGRVRLAATNFKVFKGQALELDSTSI